MRVILGLAFLTACAEREAKWVTVVRDPNYFIAIDTARIEPARAPWRGRWIPVYTVWYRTDHAGPRLHREKPFDRETVRSIVQCDSMWFKVLSVDMNDRDGRTVSRQRTSNDDLYRQPWRHVERGTSEEIAAIAACHYGRRRSAGLQPSRRATP